MMGIGLLMMVIDDGVLHIGDGLLVLIVWYWLLVLCCWCIGDGVGNGYWYDANGDGIGSFNTRWSSFSNSKVSTL